MRKWVWSGVIVGVLAIIVFGSPYLIGRIAENRVRNFVSAFQPSSQFKLSVQSYKRGWFSSRATFAIQLDSIFVKQILRTPNSALPENIPISVLATARIQHGPIVRIRKPINQQKGIAFGEAYVSGDVQLDPASQKNLQKTLLGTLPPIDLSALIKMGGIIELQSVLPAFNLKLVDGDNSLNMGVSEGYWKLDLKGKKVNSVFTIKGFTLVDGKVSLQSGDVTLKYEQRGYANGSNPTLWLGPSHLFLPELAVVKDQKTQMQVSGLSVENNAQMNAQNRIDSALNIQVQKLSLDGISYGPGRYASTFKNLDPNVVAKLQQQAKLMQHPHINQQQLQAVLITALANAMELFKQGASFELQNLELNTPDGPITAKSELSFQNEDSQAAGQPTASTETDQKHELTANQTAMANTPWGKLKAQMNLNVPIALAQKSLEQFYQHVYRHQQSAMQQQTAQPIANAATDSAEGIQKSPSTEEQPSPSTTNAAADSDNSEALGSFIPKSEVEIAELASEKARQNLNEWVNRGVLIETNGNYQMAVSLKNGEFLINGKTPNTVPDNRQISDTPAAPSSNVLPETAGEANTAENSLASDSANVKLPAGRIHPLQTAPVSGPGISANTSATTQTAEPVSAPTEQKTPEAATVSSKSE